MIEPSPINKLQQTLEGLYPNDPMTMLRETFVFAVTGLFYLGWDMSKLVELVGSIHTHFHRASKETPS